MAESSIAVAGECSQVAVRYKLTRGNKMQCG
jgi:hypothetical protein